MTRTVFRFNAIDGTKNERDRNITSDGAKVVTERTNPGTSGRRVQLLRPVRDQQGKSGFREEPVILRKIKNLNRHMYLFRFDDGATTFLFPQEVVA